MSKRGKKYSSEFKSRAVLDLLVGDKTIGEVCSERKVTSKTLQAWKAVFLKNASLAFNVEGAASKHKDDLKTKQREIDKLHQVLGKRSAELEWVTKKLKSLSLNERKSLIEPELKSIPMLKQTQLLSLNRTSIYYKSQKNQGRKMKLEAAIDETFAKTPFYGYRRIHQQLLEEGHQVGINQVWAYKKALGLNTIYPKKKINTSISNHQHKKYPYLLRDLEINRSNQVWSTDITYLRVKGGFVYLAAIIDWHSRAILAHKISNTMDNSLVLSVLNEALEKYGTPEIFNTDQGSQYTSKAHTDLLESKGIKISMDGKGRAIDNIIIERFWRSAKYENIYLSDYQSIPELKLGVREYMNFYNNRRFHQTLNYEKPMVVYNRSIAEQFGAVA